MVGGFGGWWSLSMNHVGRMRVLLSDTLGLLKKFDNMSCIV